MILIVCLFLIFNFSLNSQVHWVKIGNGINYGLNNNQSVNDIAVVFGGWKSEQQWVNKWSEELYNQKLKELGIQHLLSVKGPEEVCYENEEIDIKSLAEFVKNIIYATYFIDKVIVIAHSSGSFVAHDFLNKMYGRDGIAKDSFYVNKVFYFNLDGGIGSEKCGISIDTAVIKHIRKIYAVAAYDSVSNLYSANYETMKNFAELYGEKSELLLIQSNESDCKDKWCLHDALIITKPYNPNKYDLERDYQRFNSERRVQTDYLKFLNKQE